MMIQERGITRDTALTTAPARVKSRVSAANDNGKTVRVVQKETKVAKPQQSGAARSATMRLMALSQLCPSGSSLSLALVWRFSPNARDQKISKRILT